jgi:hypothetical protein
MRHLLAESAARLAQYDARTRTQIRWSFWSGVSLWAAALGLGVDLLVGSYGWLAVVLGLWLGSGGMFLVGMCLFVWSAELQGDFGRGAYDH